MNTELHRAALPEDDPATLADPAGVVELCGLLAAGLAMPGPPHANVPLAPGEVLRVGSSAHATVIGRRNDIPFLWELAVDGASLAEMAASGEPIRYSYVPLPVPLDYYQTVYADRPGSAEMP